MLSRTDMNLSTLESQNQEAASTVASPSYYSYFCDHGRQLLKGAAGIVGLTALGGLAYSGIRWLTAGSASTHTHTHTHRFTV